MTYADSLEYMQELGNRGIHPGLEGIRLLCEATANPQKRPGFIHVAGTNGKGSTSLFIASILRASGKKVGVYSSPAVFEELEIIKVNGRNISQTDYARLTEFLKEKNTMGCTRFEVETVMAFLYFQEKECDYVVIEAGMGGLLDATNIIEDTLCCVFTSIGMDHSDYLGHTIEAIARNKAGIIKPGARVLAAPQSPAVAAALRDCAGAACAASTGFASRASLGSVKYKKTETVFDYKNYKNLSISLLGTYQVTNAILAIEVAEALSLSESSIRKGLKMAQLPGRFETICEKPLVVIDGAHNEPASLVLRECFETYFTKKKFIYIMGMLRDKDVETVIKNTVDLASVIFTVATPNRKRTLSAFELASFVRPYNEAVTALDSIEEAVEMSLMLADKDTVIVAFGSLSHLNKVKKAVSNRKSIKKDTHGV